MVPKPREAQKIVELAPQLEVQMMALVSRWNRGQTRVLAESRNVPHTHQPAAAADRQRSEVAAAGYSGHASLPQLVLFHQQHRVEVVYPPCERLAPGLLVPRGCTRAE